MKKLPQAFHVTIELTADATLSENAIRDFVHEAVLDKIKNTSQHDVLSYATASVLRCRKVNTWR